MRLLPLKLTRYILAELLMPSLLAIGVWATVLLLNQFFFIAREAISKNLDAATTLRFVLLWIPSTLVLAIPMGTLLGTLIGVGRLSAENEIVALQGAGLGRGFLVRPVILHGLLMTAAALLVYGPLLPYASYALRNLQVESLTRANLTSELRPRVFFDRLPGVVLFVNDISPSAQGRLDGVFLYRPNVRGGQDELILAKHAYLLPTKDRPGSLIFDLHEGVGNVFRSDQPQNYRTSTFVRMQPEPIEPPPIFALLNQPLVKSVTDMTPRELSKEIEAAGTEKEPIVRRYRMRNVLAEVHSRIVLPVACLIFAILALPLGMTRVRSGKGAGFALSLGIIVGYYLIFTTSKQQALDGRGPVGLQMWLANIVMGVWAIVVYWRMFRSGGTGALARAHVALGRALARAASALSALLPPGSRRGVEPVTSPDSEPPEGPRSRRSRLGVGLIDRYVLKLYVKTLAYALAFSYLVFILVELKQLLDGIIEKRQPASALWTYFKYFIPGALNLVLPISCLIAAVVACTILARSGELTAMKAAGVSMRRACMPIFGMTLVLCGVFFLVQDRIAPETNRKAQAVRDRILGRAPRTYGISPGGRWTGGTQGRVYHYRLYDPKAREFQGLTILRIDSAAPRVLEHQFAALARWNGAQWEGQKGWSRAFPEGGGPGPFRTFDGPEPLALDPPENFSVREETVALGSDVADQSSLTELDAQITALRTSGYDTTRLRVSYFSKLAHPLTPLVMVVLGLPFAFRVGRRGTMYGVGVALVLVIVYWAAFAVSNALGHEAILPPLLAAWAPNVLFGLLGSYLMLYIKT